MMTPQGGVRLDRSVRILFGEGSASSRSDAELIRQFLDGHGEAPEAAFEALVTRHGPMVLGVSRRIVRDEHMAEDVFQAVFLILARQARRVRIGDSLGPWLCGVASRVAHQALRRDLRGRMPTTISAAEDREGDPLALAARGELVRLIDQEVTRLPRAYRDTVRLHHLAGLSHDQTAEALGLPVGTVCSRLARGRGLLRARLIRRGLAPAAVAAWFGSRPVAGRVPTPVVEATLKNLKSLVLRSISSVDPAVLVLFHSSVKRVALMKLLGMVCLVVSLGAGGLTVSAVVAARDGGPPEAVGAARPATPEDQLRRIIEEFEDSNDRAAETLWNKPPSEQWKERRLYPDEALAARRIVDIAAAHSKSRATRDALIWLVRRPRWARKDWGSIETDPFDLHYARAVELLVTHHADDPEVARLGLEMAESQSRANDEFLEGIYTWAENREARGLARMALADYLMAKARDAEARQIGPARSRVSYGIYDNAGNVIRKDGHLPAAQETYRTHLRLLDAGALRRRAERLYEEILAEYADIPNVTTTRLNMEREVRATPSATITDPGRKRKKERLREHEEILSLEGPISEPERQRRFPEAGYEIDAARKPTSLGREAAQRLEVYRKRSLIGKLAPDLAWTSIDGKPVRLSDHRGKVVILTYWEACESNCQRAIPDEKALAEKLKGRPFTFLGVAVDTSPTDARKVVEAERIPWPTVTGGRDPLSEVFFWADGLVRSPTYVVIDVDGLIRGEGGWEVRSIADLAERLVRQAEERAGGRKLATGR